MLRPYQSDLIGAIVNASKHRRLLVQSPTGSGKSVIFSEIINQAHENGLKTLFLVHRKELIFQAMDHLSRYGIQCGIIMAGEPYTPGCMVQLASVQTIYRRLGKIDMGRYGVVVVDEAHHASAATYRKILEKAFRARIYGFTATPFRKDGTSLQTMFDHLILGPTIKSLQSSGHLSDIEYMVPTIPDLRSVKEQSGDYSQSALDEKVVPKLIGGVVDHCQKYAGNKTIIFSCGVKHTNYLVKDFLRHEIKALSLDANTDREEREGIVNEFKQSDKSILINCGILTEGFDVPDCDTLIMARPTKSLTLYMQMVGRGMRPKPDGGKLLVVDHAANVYRHGLAEDTRDWELVPGKEAEKEAQSQRIRSMKRCDGCGAIINAKKCQVCGKEFTYTAHAKNVIEFKKCGLVLLEQKEQKAAFGKDPVRVWSSLVNYCAKKGWSYGASVRLFKSRTGKLPWEVDSVKRMLPRHNEWKKTARAIR